MKKIILITAIFFANTIFSQNANRLFINNNSPFTVRIFVSEYEDIIVNPLYVLPQSLIPPRASFVLGGFGERWGSRWLQIGPSGGDMCFMKAWITSPSTLCVQNTTQPFHTNGYRPLVSGVSNFVSSGGINMFWDPAQVVPNGVSPLTGDVTYDNVIEIW